ncbi:protein tweety-like [Anopheles stephensi]|uniref:protein tweety-like n=1 Tax=Anopheles stephensi TaxID=30069 RepID=UPI0016589854|nr:protein tweety-like [Anopheles stephensi]
MQQLQQQRAMLDPATAAAAAAHHLHLHQQQQHAAGGPGHVHPAQTMTINRKLHGTGGVPGGHPLPPVYGDDNPPPLPPLRNPQKALPQPVSTVAGSDPTTTDAAGSDKQIYIYSTAKYGKYDPNGKSHLHQQQQLQQQQSHPASGKPPGEAGPDKAVGGAGAKNPNTTTFSSTPGFNSKPLPSIINCPLPDIPKSASNGSNSTTSKDDIYVKRKLLSDHPNGSKFATLKPIPAPKIEPNNLNGKHQHQQHPISNGANGVGGVTPADLASQLPPPPPPPPLPVTGSSSGSSGGSSSGYGTAGLTTSQIQSLPLPPPPLELLQQQQQQTHPDDQGLRLPPPPTTEELRSTLASNGVDGQQNGGVSDSVPNGDTTLPDKAAHGHDDNSFYAVTEL